MHCSSQLRAISQLIDRGEEVIHSKSLTDGTETLQMSPGHQLKTVVIFSAATETQELRSIIAVHVFVAKIQTGIRKSLLDHSYWGPMECTALRHARFIF